MIREAIVRFRELHEQYKAGQLGADEVKRYEAEREEFSLAFVQAQQLGLRPGQSPRQMLRVAFTERVALTIGPRREATMTLDLAVGGFSADVGPLGTAIIVDFELGTPPDSVRGKAKVVASNRQPDGSWRTSFNIQFVPPDDRRKLEVWVLDAALKSVGKR
jgi:hypothetical protein